MTLPTVNDITTLSIEVSEEIEPNSLHAFLRTSIVNSNSLSSDNSYYSFFYNKNTFIYELIIFEKYLNTKLPEPFYLLNKATIKDDKIRVYLEENYFIITKNNQILIFKTIKNTDKKEIILYIEQFYKIKDFEIIEYKSGISDLDTQDSTTSDYIYPLYPKKSFNYFLVFVMISILILSGLIYQDYKKAQNSSTGVKSSQKNNSVINNSIIVSNVPDVFAYIKTNNIEIKKLFYINNQLKTSLAHKEKSYLLGFMNQYKEHIRLKSLKYDVAKSLYVLDVSLEF